MTNKRLNRSASTQQNTMYSLIADDTAGCMNVMLFKKNNSKWFKHSVYLYKTTSVSTRQHNCGKIVILIEIRSKALQVVRDTGPKGHRCPPALARLEDNSSLTQATAFWFFLFSFPSNPTPWPFSESVPSSLPHQPINQVLHFHLLNQ